MVVVIGSIARVAIADHIHRSSDEGRSCAVGTYSIRAIVQFRHHSDRICDRICELRSAIRDHLSRGIMRGIISPRTPATRSNGAMRSVRSLLLQAAWIRCSCNCNCSFAPRRSVAIALPLSDGSTGARSKVKQFESKSM